jgi:hypothetical protein
MSAIQAPMRMKDLVAEQRAAYKFLHHTYMEMDIHLKMERNKNRILYHMRVSALAKKQVEEKVALRQMHKQAKAEKAVLRQMQLDAHQQAKAEKAALREQAKAEKASLREQAKVEPDFWTDHPNLNGRRDTMAVVLKSLSLPEMSEEHMDKLMIVYAEWLLTSKHGRKCRWSLMTAFATERLVV